MPATNSAQTTLKRAVVTGASSGIGAATVEQLTRQGWSVIAVARRAERLAELSERTGALAFPCDITIADDVSRLSEFVANQGSLHALVNNAGGALGLESVAEADFKKWQRMYEVNVIGTLRVTRALLP